MIRRLVIVAWLTLVWMALWESFTWGNLLTGLLIASLATFLVPLREGTPSLGFRPLAALGLGGFFLWKLAEASLIVAWEVATPKDHTSPAVVFIPLHTSSPGIVTAVANMVSLTPGTLTIEADRERSALYIHVLHFKAPDATRAQIYQLERLTMAAFPPGADQVLDRGAMA